jgi:hypothetical protein
MLLCHSDSLHKSADIRALRPLLYFFVCKIRCFLSLASRHSYSHGRTFKTERAVDISQVMILKYFMQKLAVIGPTFEVAK